jgi:hypothetical protein
MELKDHIRHMKLPKHSFQFVTGDEVSISGDQSRPPSSGMVENAFELLAATRLARKVQAKSASEVEATLASVLNQERARRTRFSSLLEGAFESDTV